MYILILLIEYHTIHFYIIDTQRINFCRFISICLKLYKGRLCLIKEIDKFDYFDYNSKFNKNSSIFCLTYNLLLNNRDILLGYELRNVFFETLFFLFNKIYKHYKNLIEKIQ